MKLGTRGGAMTLAAPLWVLIVSGLSGCTGEIVGSDDDGAVEVVFDVTNALSKGVDVDQALVTFEATETDEVVAVGLKVRGHKATATVSLKPGQWDIVVELLEGEEVVGFGNASTVVMAGFVTEVNIRIELETGAVQITVEWDQDFGGLIADLSDRPILVEISGIGTYQVHGLSRIGWDIEVIETPTTGGRSHKDPGAVSFPDIMLLNLTSSLADAEALAAWINGPPSPRTAEFIDVRGLGGEVARIAAFDVVAVDGDASIVGTDGEFTVAGVRLGGIATIRLTDWSFPGEYPVCAAPGHTIEIPDVTGSIAPCYPDGVLDVPGAGTSDPLHLPALRDGLGLYDWAAAIRGEVEQLGCVGCGNQGRVPVSVIARDADGIEVSRMNLFESWPANFTLFNPEVEYGHAYLFDINIVTDGAEQG